MDVDALAQEIRRVDGENSLGAGALAEALIPYLNTLVPRGSGAVEPYADGGFGAVLIDAAMADLKEYVFSPDEGSDHEPTDFERMLMEDWFMGMTGSTPFNDLVFRANAALSALDHISNEPVTAWTKPVCPYCKGSGQEADYVGLNMTPVASTCSHCNGEGFDPDARDPSFVAASPSIEQKAGGTALAEVAHLCADYAHTAAEQARGEGRHMLVALHTANEAKARSVLSNIGSTSI